MSPRASLWFGRTIRDSDLRHDANIFTLLRWLLASTVMFSHSFAVTGERNLDPTLVALGFPISSLAVQLFFALSGFLVTGSIIKRGLRDFVVARLLRLVPGLWFMLLVTAMLLAIAFYTGPIANLVTGPSLYRYVGSNALLVGGVYSIDGAFAANPLRGVINGSLWTIPQEVRCYIALGLAGAVGLLASRWVVLVGLMIGIVLHLAVPSDAVPALTQLRGLAISFVFGVTAFMWRDRMFIAWPLALLVVAGAFFLPRSDAALLAVRLSAAYAMLVAAFLVPAPFKRFSAAVPDYSYGIYIYAFPVQQAMVAIGVGTTPGTNLVAGFVVTLAFAAVSWHLVEKPGLGLKSRWSTPAPRSVRA